MSTTPAKFEVYSSRREVTALVGRTWDKDGKPIHTTRHFTPLNPKSPIGHAFMTPEEANFLVESEEARKHAANGTPTFWFPAGYPMPVPLNHGGAFTEAAQIGTNHIGDERQREAARKQEEQRQAAMAAAQAKHDQQLAEEREKRDQKAQNRRNSKAKADEATQTQGE